MSEDKTKLSKLVIRLNDLTDRLVASDQPEDAENLRRLAALIDDVQPEAERSDSDHSKVS